ncbi:G3ST4 sulfotransferase, partial [Zapornia atra]|nr:G3ST4 sulfotransferase [Zapornia atra]
TGGDAPRVSPAQAASLRAWNALDWALYVHLNRSFWRKVEAFGAQRLRDEVTWLRRRREEMARRCLKGGGPIPARGIADGRLRPFQPPGRAEILGYALRPGLDAEERERCARLATPELQYKDILDRRQFGGNQGGQ